MRLQESDELSKNDVFELIEETQQRLSDAYPFLTDWSVGFDFAKKRAGVCRPGKKQISISHWHIKNNCRETILDTLLHEFSHAICYELHQEIGHGYWWKKIACSIGATPKATGLFKLPESRWMLVTFCSSNKEVRKIAARFRRNKKIRHYALKGETGTKGSLHYVETTQLALFESGQIEFEQLRFFQ